MFKTKSNHITDFPFQDYADIENNTELATIAQTHRLSNHNSWMLPQIAAHYGGWKLVMQGDKVCPKATARANMTTPWHVGLWRVVTQLKRSSLVASQNLPESVNYSAVVPIVLMGIKRFQGVPYGSWNLDPQSTLVEKRLLEAMFWRDPVVDSLGSEELLRIRELGLTVKSGDRMGTQNRATNQWCLRGVGLTALGSTPALVQTMLTQIWVCHPSLRTNYMILDPNRWDHMPEPLIQAEVLETRVKTDYKPPSKTTVALPWQ